MSIPSKTTIDNLPPSVSQRYASDEIATKGSKFYRDIAEASVQTRPQVAVLAPIQESQLETLTGFLGKTHSLALYQTPEASLSNNVFSFTVFPSFLEKDKELMTQKLEGLKTDDTKQAVDKVIQALNVISELNQMGSDAFARCRQLKQG